MSADNLEAFRRELRAWLAANLPGELRRDRVVELLESERIPRLRAWQATLAAARWVAITWPVEYGGRGASIPEQIAYVEEMVQADAPEIINNLGVGIVGPPLLAD